MEVRTFKLTTGEELIAELVKATGTGYDVMNPLLVQLVEHPKTGKPMPIFTEWLLLADSDEVVHLLEHALCSAPVKSIQGFADQYAQQITGIVLPPKSTILHG